jgi:hypothetical protein
MTPASHFLLRHPTVLHCDMFFLHFNVYVLAILLCVKQAPMAKYFFNVCIFELYPRI